MRSRKVCLFALLAWVGVLGVCAVAFIQPTSASAQLAATTPRPADRDPEPRAVGTPEPFALGLPAAPPAPLAPGTTSNGWELVFTAPPYYNPTPSPFYFYGMTFSSRYTGFAYGGADWDLKGYPGRIYRTTNGGDTWTKVVENGNWRIDMTCPFESHCWAGGKGGLIDRTTDGGSTWTRAQAYTWDGMEFPYHVPSPTPVRFTAWIRSAGSTKDGKSVIMGATDNTILTSTDGQNFYNYWPLFKWNHATWSMTCPTNLICYGGQVGVFLVKSMDAGKTWNLPAYVIDSTTGGNCLTSKYPPRWNSEATTTAWPSWTPTTAGRWEAVPGFSRQPMVAILAGRPKMPASRWKLNFARSRR